MTREEFVQSLRDAADFFESRPAMPVPEYGIDISQWVFEDYRINDLDERQAEMRKRFGTVARAMGSMEKDPRNDYYRLSKQIGPGVVVSVYCNRANVCTAKVVGERVEPGRIVPARMVPVIEWECSDPLLAS